MMNIKPHQLQHLANGQRRIKEAAKSAADIWNFKDLPITQEQKDDLINELENRYEGTGNHMKGIRYWVKQFGGVVAANKNP